jgi:hypothetical protein
MIFFDQGFQIVFSILAAWAHYLNLPLLLQQQLQLANSITYSYQYLKATFWSCVLSQLKIHSSLED